MKCLDLPIKYFSKTTPITTVGKTFSCFSMYNPDLPRELFTENSPQGLSRRSHPHFTIVFDMNCSDLPRKKTFSLTPLPPATVFLSWYEMSWSANKMLFSTPPQEVSLEKFPLVWKFRSVKKTFHHCSPTGGSKFFILVSMSRSSKKVTFYLPLLILGEEWFIQIFFLVCY